MSYTELYSLPEGLQIYQREDGGFVLQFLCPRCGNVSQHILDSAACLLEELTLECRHPHCVSPGERAGYVLTLWPSFSAMYLGESDRPLNIPF